MLSLMRRLIKGGLTDPSEKEPSRRLSPNGAAYDFWISLRNLECPQMPLAETRFQLLVEGFKVVPTFTCEANCYDDSRFS